jgi:hypothetical protein
MPQKIFSKIKSTVCQDDAYSLIFKQQNKIMKNFESIQEKNQLENNGSEKSVNALLKEKESFINGVNKYCQENKIGFAITSLSPKEFFPLLKNFKAASDFFDWHDVDDATVIILDMFHDLFFEDENYIVRNEDGSEQREQQKEIRILRCYISKVHFTIKSLVKLLISQAMACQEIENYNRNAPEE